VEISHLQRDSLHGTGTVDVRVDRFGQPRFRIHEDVAWDFLTWSESWQKLAVWADAVCFGSLAQRAPRSRRTITQFLRNTRAVRVFDVNLRQDFYSAEIVRDSIGMATIVKMNHDELPIVSKLLGFEACKEKQAAKRLLDFGPKLVCVTRANRGSLLVNRRMAVEHPGFSVQVVDTIGSGDAFTAALVHEYLRGASLEKMSEVANRMGSWVASQAGGTPVVKKEELSTSLAQLRRNRE
jgi:fructokinase